MPSFDPVVQSVACLMSDIIERISEDRHRHHSLFDSYRHVESTDKVCALGGVFVGLLGEDKINALISADVLPPNHVYDSLYQAIVPVIREKVGGDIDFDLVRSIGQEVTTANDYYREETFAQVANRVRQQYGCEPAIAPAESHG